MVFTTSDLHRFTYSCALLTIAVCLFVSLHYLFSGLMHGCADGCMMYVQCSRLRTMARALSSDPSAEKWRITDVWNRWFERYHHVLDRYSTTLAPIAFMI